MRLITMKTAWAYNGHNYDTELQAVSAAIAEIGKNITKEHACDVTRGLLLHCDRLSTLLARHTELVPPEEVDPSNSAEGTPLESLEGTRDLYKHHLPVCRARAKGNMAECSCGTLDGMIDSLRQWIAEDVEDQTAGVRFENLSAYLTENDLNADAVGAWLPEQIQEAYCLTEPEQ